MLTCISVSATYALSHYSCHDRHRTEFKVGVMNEVSKLKGKKGRRKIKRAR